MKSDSDVVLGEEVAQMLLDKMGIDTKDVMEVKLNLPINGLATVDVRHLVRRGAASGFFDELSARYTLERK